MKQFIERFYFKIFGDDDSRDYSSKVFMFVFTVVFTLFIGFLVFKELLEDLPGN